MEKTADTQTNLRLEIRIECGDAVTVRGEECTALMIPFTGSANGPHFRGKTIGPGVDTQRIRKDGKAWLSARYMLEGEDAAGNACRIFIENQGSWQDGFTPRIVTDSPLMKEWETAPLCADVEGIPGGVMVRIFRKGAGS